MLGVLKTLDTYDNPGITDLDLLDNRRESLDVQSILSAQLFDIHYISPLSLNLNATGHLDLKKSSGRQRKQV